MKLRRLVEENPEERSDFRIPFVCVIGANELEEEEMEQFYVVNSTVKSVCTDFAYNPALEERGET